jgi:hypothetical protein
MRSAEHTKQFKNKFLRIMWSACSVIRTSQCLRTTCGAPPLALPKFNPKQLDLDGRARTRGGNYTVFSEDSMASAVEGVADLQQPSVEPAEPKEAGDVGVTGDSGSAPAPGGRKGKCRATTRSGRRCTSTAVAGEDYCIMHSASPQTQALMAQARRLGGAAPRARLGLTQDVVDGLTLANGDGQIRVLEGTVKALATGAISSATASAISNIVRTASAIVATDQAEQIAVLERKVNELVIETPRGRR